MLPYDLILDSLLLPSLLSQTQCKELLDESWFNFLFKKRLLCVAFKHFRLLCPFHSLAYTPSLHKGQEAPQRKFWLLLAASSVGVTSQMVATELYPAREQESLPDYVSSSPENTSQSVHAQWGRCQHSPEGLYHFPRPFIFIDTVKNMILFIQVNIVIRGAEALLIFMQFLLFLNPNLFNKSQLCSQLSDLSWSCNEHCSAPICTFPKGIF